jgi:hypothetical protein
MIDTLIICYLINFWSDFKMSVHHLIIRSLLASTAFIWPILSVKAMEKTETSEMPKNYKQKSIREEKQNTGYHSPILPVGMPWTYPSVSLACVPESSLEEFKANINESRNNSILKVEKANSTKALWITYTGKELVFDSKHTPICYRYNAKKIIKNESRSTYFSPKQIEKGLNPSEDKVKFNQTYFENFIENGFRKHCFNVDLDKKVGQFFAQQVLYPKFPRQL